MWWLYCGLLVVGATFPFNVQAASKREADYTLDDSFWIDESPAVGPPGSPWFPAGLVHPWKPSITGEVERLLREYTQNQEMVRNIGSHYYQIIYPVQLRQHKKMGISTREIGSSKRGQGDGSYSGPVRGSGRQRTGKHFHRTSLLIKAFNHKFRLDLELNTQLIAPNIMQKHFLTNGAEQVSKQEIEHCYYHGTVQDYPGATAAFHTCNGVSGVIHVGNETFVIHPFYGGDLSKHPHVIFEARTKANKGCANSGSLEWRLNPHSGFLPQSNDRLKRDVREATKYIETAMVIDKAMFEKRNGSTRAEVVHDAIQVANIADLYFRTLNTRVSVVYVETWQGGNQAQIDRSQDISRALSNFNDYTSRKLFKVDKDTTQLLTGEVFAGGEAGMAVPATVCTAKAVGISVDINTYEPHLLAGTMAHMIGHNIGMGHDDGREECYCRDWHGCIMAQAIVGLDNVQPYKFSECSRSDYIDRLRTGNGICLLNKPNELEVHRTCGNRIVEDGEECDCGSIEDCPSVDPCCDPITCKLTSEAECASGPCCDECRLRERGVTCRTASNECDLPEHCSGESGDCPADVHKKNGNPCAGNTGFCFNGICPTLQIQCEEIWGLGGVSADVQCFDQFNSKGSITGHCGNDNSGRYVKCAPENVRCGSLQCQHGSRHPAVEGLTDQSYSSTIISIKGVEYECKSAKSGVPNLGLVGDGTPCGENLICINQTCSSIFPYLDQTKCPTNNNDLECSGHGDCTNTNKCYCGLGWSGPDCSIEEEMTPAPPLPTPPPEATKGMKDLVDIMKKKETPYGTNNKDNLSTLTMVFILTGVVKGVFICFALVAVCYRTQFINPSLNTSGMKYPIDDAQLRAYLEIQKTTVRKYEKPYVKKPQKNYVLNPAGNHSQEDTLNNADKILSFGTVPAYGRADSQRVLFRSSNHMGAGGSTHFQDHKTMLQLKRAGTVGGSGSEDEPTHSGEEETVSFIDLQHNNLKLPEKKGILKKHDYGLMIDGKDWADGSQDDMLSQADTSSAHQLGGASMSEVELTLKSLNGYHEGIIKALRTAANQRGTTTPSGSGSAMSEELLRRSLQECAASYSDYKRSGSKENVCEPQVVVEAEEEDEDDVPPCGPLRIRNLEDLIRQLEHHSRHMSPSGSEDIRMSETEADRHYRQESSSACSESSHQSHRDSRFVYGRYRQPSGRLPYPHPHHQAEEESIYESADHERGAPCGDTPDSESDEFIQAQQQLARWASEDAVPQAGTSGQIPREYFPSPSSSTSEEPTSIVRAPVPVPPVVAALAAPHPEHATIHRPKRYPEYKH